MASSHATHVCGNSASRTLPPELRKSRTIDTLLTMIAPIAIGLSSFLAFDRLRWRIKWCDGRLPARVELNLLDPLLRLVENRLAVRFQQHGLFVLLNGVFDADLTCLHRRHD